MRALTVPRGAPRRGFRRFPSWVSAGEEGEVYRLRADPGGWNRGRVPLMAPWRRSLWAQTPSSGSI